MQLLIVLAILAPCALCVDNSRRCWSSATNSAARWWDEGKRIDRGKYYYECRNAELQPMGCFSPRGDRISLQSTFVYNGYQQRCVLGRNNYLRFEYTACAPEGMGIFQPGERWEDNRRMYWFECRRDGDYLKMSIGGCMTHDKSRRIALDEEYELGDYVYTCQKKYNGSVQMCSTGCVHDGRRYKVGDQWPDGDYLYYCKIKNGKCQKICIGCQFESRRLYDGDRYNKGESVYQCEIRQDSFGHKPVACLDQGGVSRKIGCVWDRQDSSSKIELTCMLDEQKTPPRTYVKTNGCIHQHNGYDTLFVEPGTYTIWTPSLDQKSMAYACKDLGNNHFRLDTFPVKDIAYRAFSMQYSTPKGK